MVFFQLTFMDDVSSSNVSRQHVPGLIYLDNNNKNVIIYCIFYVKLPILNCFY